MAPRTRKSKSSPEAKDALTSICDPDSYLPIITGCLEEGQMELMRANHMANFMALAAELFLTNYTGIATAFEKQNGLEVTFKARFAQEKDTVDVTYKPIEVYKDSLSLNLPEEDDEAQVKMDFDAAPKSAEQPAEPPVEPPFVEAEVLLLNEPPAETLLLNSPRRTDEEEDAYQQGRESAAQGFAPDSNPYDENQDLFQAWRDGWHAQRAEQEEADALDQGDADDDAEPSEGDEEII